MRIFVNNIELDCDARFQIKYRITDGLTASAAYSSEITLPETSNNFRAFGLNDMVITEDDIFNLQDARADENGIDLGIEKAELISTSPFIIRIYGTNSNYFNQLKGKLSDMDWTDLDHEWNSTNIIGGISLPSGYCYPIINYGILDTVTDNIQCSECYPAIYVSTAIEKMSEGYTLDIGFEGNYKYNSLIIPFSNEFPSAITDEEKELSAFEVYSSGQALTLSTETELTFANEVTDNGSNFSTRYTVPYNMFASFLFEVAAKSHVALTTTDVTFALYKDNGSPVLLNTGTYNFPATYTNKTVIEFSSYFELNAGDEIYITATGLTQDVDIRGGLDANDDGYTRFLLLDIKNVMVLGFTWRVGLNLPDITKAQLMDYILNSFGAVIQVDEIKKVVYLTKLDDIKNSQGEDWTSKIDLKTPIKRTFDMLEVGQKSKLAYQDDDNVTKPTGTDYEFIVNSDKLEAEKTIYTAPFAACMTENKFSFGLPVVNIEVDGESPCKPRILINKLKRLTTDINFQVNYSTVGTDNTVFVPYFYDLSKPYDLTWSKLASNNLSTKISMIQNPRGLELLARITASDINQLDFRERVWIGTIGTEVVNAWFFISEVNYDTHESSLIKLKLL